MSKNDITGDEIKSKTPSVAYRDNYDAIFRKGEKNEMLDSESNAGSGNDANQDNRQTDGVQE